MTSDATASRSIIQAYGDCLRQQPSRRHYRLLAMGGRGGVYWRQPYGNEHFQCQHNGYCERSTNRPTSELIILHCTESSLHAPALLLLGDVDN